jgi:CBS domain-containing protein
MLVKEICQRDVVTCAVGAPLRNAATLMRENHVGDVVVVDASDRPLGVVTDRDLVVEVLARGVDPDSVSVGDLVADGVQVARLDQSALDALQSMSEHGIRRLPVVDADGALAGIVSSDEMLDLLSRLLSALSELSRTGRAREAQLRR